MKKEETYVDQLLGQRVLAGNNRRVGRLEEFHCEQHGGDLLIVEYVIGSAGLMERLNVGMKALFGIAAGGKLARWDQIDISDPEHPRLTCSIADLRDLEAWSARPLSDDGGGEGVSAATTRDLASA